MLKLLSLDLLLLSSVGAQARMPPALDVFTVESTAQQRACSKLLEEPVADGARESLKLILSSVVFR